MKVGKEEIIGLVAALERYVNLDHARLRQAWKAKAEYIAGQLQGVDGLEATVVAEGEDAPYVELIWDDAIGVTRLDLRTTLRRREQRRMAMSTLFGGNRVQTLCMRDGEEILAARYLREFFLEGSGQP